MSDREGLTMFWNSLLGVSIAGVAGLTMITGLFWRGKLLLHWLEVKE